jgi:class 3 adenylate cyclase
VTDTEVRYAERDGDYLAYSVFGDGPVDLAVTQNRFPIDLMWELPQLASFMESLGRIARVIVWDPRGFGASDQLGDARAYTNETAAEDRRAVLDAADSKRPTLLDLSGTSGSVLFAATYPERVRSLILVSLRETYAELRSLSLEQRKKLALRLKSPDGLRIENPRVAHDPVLQRWWARAGRLGSSPGQLAAMMAAAVDTTDVLPSVRVPTLVLHRRDNRVWDIETSRAAARLLPNARFVELPGAENDLFLGDTAPVLGEIERFLAEPEVKAVADRVLATVLFTDIVSSTEHLAAAGDQVWRQLLDGHERDGERVVTEFRGRMIKNTGDGILATFDGPARAVRCAAALLDAAHAQGITLRIGLHTGEIELRPADIAGIAVHIASRIADLAAADEILVSRTVVDLTAGSGLQFEPRGEHQLKGVPGTWQTFVAQPST